MCVLSPRLFACTRHVGLRAVGAYYCLNVLIQLLAVKVNKRCYYYYYYYYPQRFRRVPQKSVPISFEISDDFLRLEVNRHNTIDSSYFEFFQV